MAKSLKEFVDEALKNVKEVEPHEVGDLAQTLILDVREPDEFLAGHIPGAINIPRGFLEVRADLEHHKRDPRLSDRSLKIVCYCGGGHRSALAAQTLTQMGFENPLSMRGGWTAYTAADLPQE